MKFVFVCLSVALFVTGTFCEEVEQNDVPNESEYTDANTSPGVRKASEKRYLLDDKPVYARIQHGTSAHDGRVELFAFGRWGTVCNDDWDDQDAAVICHMLGFPRTNAKARRAGNGVGLGTILLDNVHCVGTEASIELCPANKWGTNDCSHLQDAGVTCDNSTRPDNFLLFTDTSNHLIFRMDLTTNSVVLVPLTYSRNPIALGYDPVDNRIYWTDVMVKEIHSITSDGQDQRTVKYLGSTSVADGLAVDSISRLLVYTDAGTDTITLLSLDGTKQKVVINSGLDQPRAIELDPLNGVMYWSDWGNQSKIEKANYDGSNRQTIISTGLKFPNAIALDLQGNKIYWADAGTDKIEVANMDGTNRQTLYEEPLAHEFGMTLYQNVLYYTDWSKTGVMRLSTYGGIAEPVGPPGFGRLNDITAYHSGYGPSGPNGCSTYNGGCSGICVPRPGMGRRCL